jgi:hypothetical protein
MKFAGEHNTSRAAVIGEALWHAGGCIAMLLLLRALAG